MRELTEKCSLFKPYQREGKWCMGAKKAETVNIIDMLLMPWQTELLTAIRSEPNEDKQKEMKKQLWAISASSIMLGGRGTKYITEMNGLMAFDIDPDKNKDLIEFYDQYFEAVCDIPYTVYAGRSARGKGIWGLFRISGVNKFREHFEAMKDGFAAMGIVIDPAPSSAASIRFVSYDENGYFNDDALIYSRLKEMPVAEKKKLEIHEKQINETDGKVLIQRFNTECTAAVIDEILTAYGFKYDPKHSTEDKFRFIRPGKEEGISLDYHDVKKTLFCFSSEVDHLDRWKVKSPGWACSPLTALRVYGIGWPNESDPDAVREHWGKVFGYIKTKL